MPKPLFSKRHYEFLAKTFLVTYNYSLTPFQMAQALSADNPKFNMAKFLQAAEKDKQ